MDGLPRGQPKLVKRHRFWHRSVSADAEYQIGIAERDAITIAQHRPFDRGAIQQKCIAGAGGKIDQQELVVGRALDQRVMAMDRGVIERHVVVAVTTDTKQLTGKDDLPIVVTRSGLDPGLVAGPRSFDRSARADAFPLATTSNGTRSGKEAS